MKKNKLKQLIKESLLENGYSNYYPGKKTPGLTTDVLNKILLKISQGPEEKYEGDPENGNKILDRANQDNVDKILRGEDNEVDRMQELAGFKNEITINNPLKFPKYKDVVIDDLLKLREEDKDETYDNNDFYDKLINDIKNSTTIEEINNIVFKDFFMGDDTEGMEDFKRDIEERIK